MKEESLREQVKRVAHPVFNKFLQEAGLGSMALKKMLFRPNNYRRKVNVFLNDLKRDSTSQKVQSAVLKGDELIENIHISSSNKLIFIKCKNHITLQIGKNTMVGIYNQVKDGKKVVFEITGDTDDELAEVLEDKSYEIAKLIDDTMRMFCSRFDLRHDGNIEFERQEIWLKGDEFIDKLPKDMILHDTVFKKVYGEGLEFKSGKEENATVHVKNYIKNRSVDMPKLEAKIDLFNDKFNKIIDLIGKQAEANLFLAQNVNTHIPMIKKLGDNAEKLANEVSRMNSINNNWFEDI